MWNEPSKERLDRIPRLYETEEIELQDKLVHLHFFIAGSDWYAVEYDPEQNVFFGYCVLNNDFLNAEWGYFDFQELKELSIVGFEVDCELEKYWRIRKASEIDKICEGNTWKCTVS